MQVPTEPQAAILLKAGVSAGVTVPASEPGASGVNSWIPPQQFLAGGIGGIITWLIVHSLSVYAHIDIPPDLQTYITGAVAAALVYFVPPARRDAAKVMDDELVHALMKDPASNVSYVQTPVTPPSGEPATIVPPATKA